MVMYEIAIADPIYHDIYMIARQSEDLLLSVRRFRKSIALPSDKSKIYATLQVRRYSDRD